MKTQVTIASITEDLDRITAGAEAAAQWGAAKGAVETKAKLHGLMVERHESGEPGAFGDSQDTVLARVAAELGADAAADLARALERVPGADVPLPDDPSPLPVPSTSGNDTLN